MTTRRHGAFWRNLAIVVLLHAGVLIGMSRWTSGAKRPLRSEIVWIGDAIAPATAPDHHTLQSVAPAASPPAPEETQTPPMEKEDAPPIPSPAISDFPSPSATPRPSPRISPRPSPKKAVLAKATPPPKKRSISKEKKKITVKGEASKGASAGGKASRGGAGGTNPSQLAWYGNMLHDRFFGAWVQPTSVVSTGARISVLVRIRIEKDGRISDFVLVRPSGNVVVDESVAAVAKRVPQVDAPPAGLGAGGHYDVNINFELNAE